MARRKSDAEVGPLGVWAYDTRDALDLSVEAVVAALPTAYHPATLRKVEGGSARPGTRMWRELAAYYGRVAQEKGIDLEPQPRLRPEPLEATETADPVALAIRDQTAAIVAAIEAQGEQQARAMEVLAETLGATFAQLAASLERTPGGSSDEPEGRPVAG